MLPFNFEGWGFFEKREIRLFISFSLQINDKKNTSKFSRELEARQTNTAKKRHENRNLRCNF